MLKTLKKIKASEIEVIAVVHQRFLWKGLLLGHCAECKLVLSLEKCRCFGRFMLGLQKKLMYMDIIR